MWRRADFAFGNPIHKQIMFGLLPLSKILVLHPFFKILTIASNFTNRGQFLLDSVRLKKKPTELANPDHLIWQVGAYGDVNWTCSYFNVSKRQIIEKLYTNLINYQNRSLCDIISLNILSIAFITTNIWSKLAESQNKIMFISFF